MHIGSSGMFRCDVVSMRLLAKLTPSGGWELAISELNVILANAGIHTEPQIEPPNGFAFLRE